MITSSHFFIGKNDRFSREDSSPVCDEPPGRRMVSVFGKRTTCLEIKKFQRGKTQYLLTIADEMDEPANDTKCEPHMCVKAQQLYGIVSTCAT